MCIMHPKVHVNARLKRRAIQQVVVMRCKHCGKVETCFVYAPEGAGVVEAPHADDLFSRDYYCSFDCWMHGCVL